MTRIQLRQVVGLALATIGCWMLFVGPAAALTGPQVANQQYGYPYPNSPDCDEYGSGGCVVDQWAFYQGQCTSWTAFRLSQMNGFAFNNYYGGAGRWGDASSWGTHARGLGIAVDGNPAVGAVAWYSSGHVGYVEQVNSPTSVVISEMNYDLHNGFRLYTISPGNRWPSGFIHIRDRTGGGGIADGTFVSVSGGDGRVYRVAGGSPIYVSSWAAVGGPKPVTPVSQGQLDAMRPYPADGTLLGASDGRVYIVAGGAPLYLSDWSQIGGPKPSVGIDAWAVQNAGNPYAHLRPVPMDGTTLGASSGRVYIVAGGAPLYLSDWSQIGGPRPSVAVDKWAVENTDNPAAHMNTYPADGTTLGASDGRVYVVAGGAPTYVSNWDAIGGPRPSVAVDKWAVENPENPHAHLRRYPADGTVLAASGGGVFIVAGGAPLYLSNWAAIGGPKPYTAVDEWAIQNPEDPHAHLRRYPADGTFLRASDGAVYKVAGGAPFWVSDWARVGGPQPFTSMDVWDIQHRDHPLAHLRVAPADGTVVRGIPSKALWSWSGGMRAPGSSPVGAVTVDDAGVGVFPMLPASGAAPSSASGVAPPAQKRTTSSTSGGGTRASGVCRSARAQTRRKRSLMLAARSRARRAGGRGHAQRLYRSRLKAYRRAVSDQRLLC